MECRRGKWKLEERERVQGREGKEEKERVERSLTS